MKNKKRATAQIELGLLTGLLLLSCGQPSHAEVCPVPDYVASLRPGMEYTLSKESPVYKVIDRYWIEKERCGVIEVKAVFDKPVSYGEGVEKMAFPRLETNPSECEKDSEERDVTFTTFYVQMEIDEAADTWQPSSIVAYKPGDNPSVAVYSARVEE